MTKAEQKLKEVTPLTKIISGMKWFKFMKKKELTREEQGKIIADRLEKIRQLHDYWARISRRFVAGEKVEIRIDERLDEDLLKNDT